jgi:hypothetical protein
MSKNIFYDPSTMRLALQASLLEAGYVIIEEADSQNTLEKSKLVS